MRLSSYEARLKLSKSNKDKEHPWISWYFDRKDEKHLIDMAIQMGLQVDAFVALVDEMIEECNLSAHFSHGEYGSRVLDYRYL